MITESCMVLRVLTSRKGSDVWDCCGLFWDVPNNLPLSALGLYSPSRGIQGHPRIKQSMAVLDIRNPVSYVCVNTVLHGSTLLYYELFSQYLPLTHVAVCVCGDEMILQH